jgi:hypothetical protein
MLLYAHPLIYMHCISSNMIMIVIPMQFYQQKLHHCPNSDSESQSMYVNERHDHAPDRPMTDVHIYNQSIQYHNQEKIIHPMPQHDLGVGSLFVLTPTYALEGEPEHTATTASAHDSTKLKSKLGPSTWLQQPGTDDLQPIE